MLQGTQIEDAMIAAKCRSNRRCPSASSRRRGGLVTLKDSGRVLWLSIFHQPEIIGQPPGTSVWGGYGLYPERNGDFVRKRWDQCTGPEDFHGHRQKDRIHRANLRADRQRAGSPSATRASGPPQSGPRRPRHLGGEIGMPPRRLAPIGASTP